MMQGMNHKKSCRMQGAQYGKILSVLELELCISFKMWIQLPSLDKISGVLFATVLLQIVVLQYRSEISEPSNALATR